MSIALMSEAWRTSLPSTRKLVLLALCDNANDQGECYPSVPMIAVKCSLGERIVYDCLRELARDGYLYRDTRTGRSTIYRITNPCTWCTPAPRAPLHHVQDTPAQYAGVRSGQPLHHVHPTPAPRADTPAPRAPITVTQSSSEPVTPPLTPPPSGLDVAVWDRWREYRHEIRKPIKPASLLAAQRKLAGFGADQAAVVEQSIANGWQGLFPLKDAPQHPQQKRRTIHDERAATIAALTGRDRAPSGGRIIDITPAATDIVD